MDLVDLSILDYGLIKGRDSLNIIEIKSYNPKKIEVIVSLFNSLCRNEIFLKITFEDIIIYKIFDDEIRGILNDEEFDMYSESDTESVFMEIENSILANKNKHLSRNKELRHIIIETYDFKIECVCEVFTVEKLSKKPS